MTVLDFNPTDSQFVELLLGVAHIGLAVVMSVHIVLHKHDVRAAIGWTGMVWLAPIVGSILYVLLGINRIRRQAGRIRRKREMAGRYTAEIELFRRDVDLLPNGSAPGIQAIATLVGITTGEALTTGNDVDLLVNGDEAYPRMIDAIDRATRSVILATYIFDHGQAGDRFVTALGAAAARGVAVRVLIDGVGARYSRPPVVGALRRHGVTVARFLPSLFPLPHPYSNLRNHRKLLVVDGAIGFCGGMNIRDGCILALGLSSSTQDVHFQILGPVVGHLMKALAFDWAFTTHEQLEGEAWFPRLEPAGPVLARGIADGPDEDFETLLMTFMGAISQATKSIRLATPYFLPDPSLIDALRIAALRGVRVDIVIPQRGNLRIVEWAATGQMSQVVKWGCRVHLSPPPFDHSKILVVDGEWSLIGSANWDPRSLRLNFEYGVECYSAVLAGRLDRLLDAKIAAGRRLTLDDLQRRSFPIRLRDGVARLAQPYL